MKIRALIPDEPGHASNWWRIIRPFTMLRSLSYDVSWHTSLDGVDIQDATVVLHRMIPENPNRFMTQLARKKASRVVYSLDDLTCDREALEDYLVGCGGLTKFAIQQILDRIPRQLETMQLCDMIVTSTKALAYELDFVHVNVLENAIDERYFLDSLSTTPEYIDNGNLVYIGYASGRRPSSDFENMAKAWQFISNAYSNVRFVVAGWQPDTLDSMIDLDKKVRIPWRPVEQYGLSMQVDIGCCPIANTKFNSGKSDIKFQEYTLAGAAVIADYPVYEQAIINSVTGYLCRSVDQWIAALMVLIESKIQRKHIQDNANYEIHNLRTLEATISDWVMFYED